MNKGLVWLGWVGFYGISTFVGYLISNPVYTYIKYIGFVNKLFAGNILKRSRAHLLAHS